MAETATALAFGPFHLDPFHRALSEGGRALPIRGRAFDLLLALVERRDRVVGKDELMALVWPGRVVEEGNLTVHVAALRRLLGRDSIATLSGRGYRFVAPVTLLPASAPQTPAEAALAAPPRAALPQPLTRLVGRTAELDRLAAQLGEARLVTVVGAGGVGKTRLALAAAERAAEQAAADAWLADLGPLEDPRMVAPAIAAALGLDPGGGDALGAVLACLGSRHGLLLLDGCEHLLRAAADAAEAILRACPGMAILATSREPLRAEGERLHRLQPLDTAAADCVLTAAELADYPASALFLDRAAAALGGFAPEDAEAAEVMRICRRLDGLPLAIELAAPALRAMPLAELGARLDRHFGPLTAGRRTALARQQTLRATIGWSLGLLEPAERALLLRLSVFAGNWTAEAAAFVAGDLAGHAEEIAGLIAALVDKSLVQADLGGAQARYRLLDATRYYAAEQLPAPELAAARASLLHWLLQAYESAEADWPFLPDDDWFAIHAPQIETLRAALAWAFGPGGDARQGVLLASLTEHVWGELSLKGELRDWFDLAIAHIDATTPPDVAGRLWLGRCGWLALRGSEALEAARRAVALFRAAGSRIDLGRALWRQAWQHVLAGDVVDATPLLEEAEALLRGGRPNKALVSCLRVRSTAWLRAGQPAAAAAALEEALALARQLRSPRDVALTLGGLAELHCAAGRMAEAIAVAQAALASLGPGQARSAWVQHIGGAEASYRLALGDVAQARPIVAERLAVARMMGLPHEVAANLERAALIAAMEGRLDSAARLHGHVERNHAPRGILRSFGSQAVQDRLQALLHARLAPAELARLAAQGASLDEAAMVAEAGGILRPA
ncbi:ATP-binding protein [Falsiroseomonas sp.]|uniref:ATP-binding protein n=1 Tax=Falsiroseomonas sp. TaxID=2870721 RepID=UPI003F7171D1